MSPLVRTALAVFGGVVVAGLCIALMETIGHNLNSADPAIPFLAALAGYALGTAVGASLAKRLAAQRTAAAWTVIGLLAILALFNLFALPHPWWFAPAAALIFVSLGWLITWRTPE